MSLNSSKYASGFSPQNIPGLAIWLDAADSNAVTQSAGVVSYWRDKSPSPIDVSQNTVGARPTYESNVQNGLPAVRFTTSQMMRSTSNFTLDRGQTWFVSFKALASGNIFFVEQGPNTNTTNGQFLYGGNNSLMYMTRSGGSRFIDDPAGRGTTPFSTNVWYVCGFVTSNNSTASTDVYWSINGTPRTCAISGTVTGTATNQLYINNTARVPGSNYMGEIIIYNWAMPSNQVRLVERYLAYKWGVTLSNTHPYFSIPATLRTFNPLDVSGLTIWLDAGDYRKIDISSISNRVTSWSNKAYPSQDFSMNPTGGTFMTYITDGRGYPAISNPGGANYQSSRTDLSATMLFSDASTCTLFGAWDICGSQTGTFGSIFNINSPGNPTVIRNAVFFTGSTQSGFFQTGGAGGPEVSISTVFGSPRIHTFRRNALQTIFRDYGTQTTSNSAASGLDIDRSTLYQLRMDDQAVVNSKTYEILWYNRALTDNEVYSVENYLAERWGLRGSMTSNSPMRFYRSLTPVFQPGLLANCVVWLDAADSTTITLTGSNVTRWNDKITAGTQNATQSSFVSPTLGTVNGVQALQYNAAAGTGMVFTASSFTPASTGFSYFAAFYGTTNSTGNTRIFQAWVSGDRICALAGGFSNPTSNMVFYAGGASNNIASVAVTSNVMNVVSVVENTSTANIAANGALATIGGTSQPVSNATITSTSLGIGFTGVDRLDGYFCEMIWYNRALSINERQIVEAYLANKWKINALLSNQPYKNTPV